MKRSHHYHSLSLALEERKPKEIKTLSPDTSRTNINVLAETQNNLNYLMTNVKSKFTLHKNQYIPSNKDSISPIQRHYTTTQKIISSHNGKSVFMSNLTSRLAELEGKLNVYQEKANHLKLSYIKSNYSPSFNRTNEVLQQKSLIPKQTFLIPTINIHNHNHTELYQSKNIELHTSGNHLEKSDNKNLSAKELSKIKCACHSYSKNIASNMRIDDLNKNSIKKNQSLCLLGQSYNIKILKESLRQTKEDVIDMKAVFKELLIETQQKILNQIHKDQKVYFRKINETNVLFKKEKELLALDLTTSNKIIEKINEDLLESRNNLSQVEEQKMNSFKQNFELKAEVLLLKEELNNFTFSNKLHLQNLESQLSRNEGKINQLNKDLEYNTIDNNNNIETIKNLTTGLEKKEIALINLQSNNESLIQQIKEKNNQLSEIIENNVILTNGFKANELKYKNIIEEQIKEFKDLKNKYNTLYEENCQINFKFTQMQHNKGEVNDNEENLEKEINDLKAIIQVKNLEYEEQTNELVLLNEEMLILKNELTKEKVLSKQNINDLQTEYDQYKAKKNGEIEELNYLHIKEKDQINNQLKDEKDNSLIVITKLNIELNNIKDELINHQKQILILSQELDKSKSNHISLEVFYKDKLNIEQIELKRKKKEFLECQTRSEALLQETKELHQIYINKLKNDYESQIQSYSDHINIFQKSIEDLTIQNNTLKASLQKEKDNHSSTRNEIDALTSKINNLNATNIMMTNELNQSKTDITRLIQENQSLTNSIRQNDTDVSLLKEENAFNPNTIKQLNENLQNLQKEIVKATTEKIMNANKSKKQINFLESKIESQKTIIHQLEQSNTRLIQDLNDVEKKSLAIEHKHEKKNDSLTMPSSDNDTKNKIILYGENDNKIMIEIEEVEHQQGERGSILKEKGFYKKAINKANE